MSGIKRLNKDEKDLKEKAVAFATAFFKTKKVERWDFNENGSRETANVFT